MKEREVYDEEKRCIRLSKKKKSSIPITDLFIKNV